jgi:hypothetical protein
MSQVTRRQASGQRGSVHVPPARGAQTGWVNQNAAIDPPRALGPRTQETATGKLRRDGESRRCQPCGGTADSSGVPLANCTSRRDMSPSRSELAVVTVEPPPATDIHQPRFWAFPPESKATSW